MKLSVHLYPMLSRDWKDIPPGIMPGGNFVVTGALVKSVHEMIEQTEQPFRKREYKNFLKRMLREMKGNGEATPESVPDSDEKQSKEFMEFRQGKRWLCYDCKAHGGPRDAQVIEIVWGCPKCTKKGKAKK